MLLHKVSHPPSELYFLLSEMRERKIGAATTRKGEREGDYFCLKHIMHKRLARTVAQLVNKLYYSI